MTSQARIDEIDWYHEFDFGRGLKARSTAPDVSWHRQVWRFVERQLEGVDFRDKTVLEVGAWDGYWSFLAERRGAKYVLASDDLTQNWSDGRGIHLAKEMLGSHVDINQGLSVYRLGELGRTFDIVMCFGVVPITCSTRSMRSRKSGIAATTAPLFCWTEMWGGPACVRMRFVTGLMIHGYRHSSRRSRLWKRCYGRVICRFSLRPVCVRAGSSAGRVR